ncbi:hypothetical protein NDU88_000424 [Pleurodeles waltl]|uniref:Uncharacterized protein n=1 Tax=Pleurodeles waltl TaxID=8319 RepID=A0AAV7V7V3_PLEWA|nr:hypothetical protein NDU88_000424 [Pleurodeles waltl]
MSLAAPASFIAGRASKGLLSVPRRGDPLVSPRRHVPEEGWGEGGLRSHDAPPGRPPACRIFFGDFHRPGRGGPQGASSQSRAGRPRPQARPAPRRPAGDGKKRGGGGKVRTPEPRGLSPATRTPGPSSRLCRRSTASSHRCSSLPEAQERGLSCPPPFWSPASPGPAACKFRAEEPTDPTGGNGGAASERPQGPRGSSDGAGWCVD